MTPTELALPTSANVDELRTVVVRPGPFATIVTAHQPHAEGAADLRKRRFRAVSDQLTDAGAPASVIDAVEVEVLADPQGYAAQCVVADSDGVLLRARHLEPPRAEFARWAAAPSLATVIEWRQLSPAHVVAIIDRTGADVFVTPDHETAGRGPSEETVKGEHDEIRKVHPGGWSTRRFQQRAEDSWEHNAADVAERLTQLVRAVRAHTLIIGGDSHAVGLVRDRLPAAIGAITHVVEGADRRVGLDSISTDVLHLVATAAAEETVAFLDAWREELGRKARAVEGWTQTVEALRQASVAVLGIHDEHTDDRKAWFGDSAELIALDPATLRDLGAGEEHFARIHDVIIRAALLTGADIRIVPAHGGPANGIGAILRWAV